MDLKRFAMYVGPAAQTSEFHNQLFSSDLKQALASTAKPLWEEATPEGFSNLPSFVQMLYYDTTVRLPDAVVHHLDRASMAYSLEARVPYLDDKLVEFCARTPRRMKMRGLQEKHILRKALRADLPPDIASRRKRGLSAPFQQWLREPLPDFAVDLLSEARLREKGYFNPAFVASLLEQHRAGCAKYGRQLLGILGVQIWDDMFLHGCRPNVP
jgi:asparagine synthase (glutamine-hydrolysing)